MKTEFAFDIGAKVVITAHDQTATVTGLYMDSAKRKYADVIYRDRRRTEISSRFAEEDLEPLPKA